jgi:hypothetical protein
MGTTQITGSMIITNIDRLHDPRNNVHADVFGAIMNTNLMDFRLLKNGVAELNYFGDSDRTRLTPKAFAEALTAFLKEKNIADLEYKGAFMFVEIGNVFVRPVITKVSVNTDSVALHEASLTWAVKEDVNA